MGQTDPRTLVSKGRLWEVFGFSDNHFTALELTKRFSALRAATADPAVRAALEKAFSILNAPRTRQQYVRSRTAMDRVREQLGDALYSENEDAIWTEIWEWAVERGVSPDEEIIDAVVERFRLPVSPRGSRPDTRSVATAQAILVDARCQSCGRSDHSLRLAVFPYVVSIVIVAFRRAADAGVYCQTCRYRKSLKWGLITSFTGWWSLWGFFWTVKALIDNGRGGSMPEEENRGFLAQFAWASATLGKIAQAKSALRDLRSYGADEESSRLALQLHEEYPEVQPLSSNGFRYGFLGMVLSVVATYSLIGMLVFGFPGGASAGAPSVPESAQGDSAPSQSPPEVDSADDEAGMSEGPDNSEADETAEPPEEDMSESGEAQSPPAPDNEPSFANPPDDSYVAWSDNSEWVTYDSVQAEGTVRNTHDVWTIIDVHIEVEFLDSSGNTVGAERVVVQPSTIEPQGLGLYRALVDAPSDADRAQTGLLWYWEPP
ncbi:MAG: hypothetical protein ACOC6F_02130 [bacterium]